MSEQISSLLCTRSPMNLHVFWRLEVLIRKLAFISFWRLSKKSKVYYIYPYFRLPCSFSLPAAAAKSLQSCLTLYHPIDSSPLGSAVPGILHARTQVGCHFLLQCMKVKSESEVAQSGLTLSDPMDCSLPGSSVHWIFSFYCLLSD